MAPLSSTARSLRHRLPRVAALGALVAITGTAQAWAGGQGPAVIAQAVAAAAPKPFLVGERLAYEVRLANFRVGQGTMEVQGIEDVRGRPTWHAVFAYNGSALGAKVNDRHETWFDTANFSSRRFYQDIDNPGYDRTRRYEIFPERGMFREGTKPEEPTPQNPLDDASFLYFVRTLPLEVGKTYTFPRYFKAEGNPVIIKVVRRERVKVPAGSFNTVVLQPTFRSKGLFSEGGKAEVWISDDPSRVVVQIKSKVAIIGSLSLYLKSHNTRAGK